MKPLQKYIDEPSGLIIEETALGQIRITKVDYEFSVIFLDREEIDTITEMLSQFKSQPL